MDRQTYLNLIVPAIEMVAKKGEDYNSGEVTLDAYFPHGDYSYHQMLHIKILRLQSLLAKDGDPNYDSLEDCLYDLINYAVFWLGYLKNKSSKLA